MRKYVAIGRGTHSPFGGDFPVINSAAKSFGAMRIMQPMGNHHMRAFIPAVLTAALLSTSLYAAEVPVSAPEPLAPGKAAGVQKADMADGTFWWLLGGAAVIAIIAVAASSGGSSSNNVGTTVTGTTSTS
jgi:hypothetical protein